MALRTVPAPALLLAAALVLAACCSGAGGCEKGDGGKGCLRAYSLVGCAPPTDTPAAADDDGTAFLSGLAPLLAALPSAAAATGFASLRSAGADSARAFGLCFGEPHGCLACLSAAAAAVTEACGNDTRRAGVWRDGCLLAYADDGGSFKLPAGDARDQALADLARALAERKGQSLWKVLSVLFYALAAVGVVAIVLLLCFFVACFMLAQTLFGQSAAVPGFRFMEVANAGHAGAGQGGEGITAYVVATNGRSPLWSVGVQMRFY